MGFAIIKLSGSLNKYGLNKINIIIIMIKIKIPKISLKIKKGYKEVLLKFLLNPNGLVDPVWWRSIKWINININTTNGIKKCKLKNRLRVGLSTENPPQTHWTKSFPIYGIAEIRFVITEAPQNDICPQGNTYPKNAVIIVNKKIITPTDQVSKNLNE